jgi:PilZ domain-containing protein
MDPADKRRAQRFTMALPVSLRADSPNGTEAAIKTRDISSSGVYLEFDSPIDIGSSLEFVLTLPAEITKGQAVRVKCRGKVVRVDRPAAAEHTVGVAATIERYEFLREI